MAGKIRVQAQQITVTISSLERMRSKMGVAQAPRIREKPYQDRKENGN
jgi:hypothetical protein